MRTRILTIVVVGAMLLVAARSASAALLALKPGPIDRPLFLLSADFDRDGYADLAIADFEAGAIQILINQHDGTFAPHLDSPVVAGGATFNNPTGGPLYMAVGDLNPEDVDSDGVPNSSDNCPNLYNPADGTGKQDGTVCRTKPLANCPGGCLNDCDCDGILDFDPNTNTLDNCPRAYNPTQAPSTAAGADGVCGTPDDLRSLYGPDGLCGTSDDRTDASVGSACAGSPDLVIVDTNFGSGFLDGIIRVRVNDGTGQLIARTPYAAGIGPSQILLDDFNGNAGKGDGHLDLVVSNSANNNLQVQFGLTDGLFSPEQALSAGRGPEGLASGDFNGDGRCDLAAANRTGETIGVYFNDGRQLPASPQVTLSLPGSAPTDLLSGRVDNDGLDDLVVLDQGTSTTGAIEVFFGSMASTLTAGPSMTLPSGSRPRGGVLRDLDNDGVPDLVVDDFTGGQVFIYKGTGNRAAPFTLANTLTGMANPAAVTALDFDPNGAGGPALDLAVLDFATNRVYLFHNEGSLNFAPATASPVVSAWNGSSAMSFFGADGLSADDLVLLHRSPPRIDILSGIGNGFFRPTFPILLNGPKKADGMILSDIRQDNFPDLLVLDQTSSLITVVTGDASGTMVERQSYAVPTGAAAATFGSLLTSTNDYDGDGVPDVLDDCPTVYNPPDYKVCTPNDPGCELVGDFCVAQMPTGCLNTDPVTGQCDSDQNGIGDQCQLLAAPIPPSTVCPALDTDGDLVFDYNPNALGAHDIDGDGVPDALDNCPNVSNPRDASGKQPDRNNNGVGDACETPPANCIPTRSDCDGDGVIDFDPNFITKLSPFCQSSPASPTCHDEVMVAALDNCPTVYNPGQEDNDADHVGNACVIHAALDNCPFVSNKSQADCGLTDCTMTNGPAAGHAGNGIGDACDAPPNDVVVVTPASAALTILEGDGAGHLSTAPYSPVNGRLNNPSSALVGSFSLECIGGPLGICTAKSANDILVAERGVVPNSSDDDLKVLAGSGTGAFPVSGTAPAQGDPIALMTIPAQPICAKPYPSSTSDGGLRFDFSGRSNIVVALEPGTSTLGIYLVSNTGLVPPIANQTPLPVPGILMDAAFNDLNRDGLQDLVALSKSLGSPPVSYVTVFLGMGNGLFYTDPTLNPLPVAGDAAFIEAGVAHLRSSLFPDVMLFNRDDGAPIVLSNVLTGRVDIDGSGRVDGFDLALLARSFGSRRGLDFVLQNDATLQQVGTGFSSVVLGSGTEMPGQDLTAPSPACLANTTSEFQAVNGAYGIPVDINLDGQVDGTDLALLAILFGSQP